MHHFQYIGGILHAEQVPLPVLAQHVGTPTYVYSRATLTRHYQVLTQAFGSHPHTVCFAVKSNPNLAVLQVLAHLGAGADVVSGGELFRARRAGIPSDKIVFSGVGKTKEEMQQGLSAGIRSFHVESVPELELLNHVALSMNLCAPVSVRINPDVDAATHPYISTGLKSNKFGIPAADAAAVYQRLAQLKGIRVHGVASHIGSQMTQLAPIAQAARRLVELALALRTQGHPIEEVDFGGGLGIAYAQETPPSPAEYAAAILQAVGKSMLHVVVEPGRVIVGNAGVLLGQVLFVKPTSEKTFVITDVGMNDALRPALYGAHHHILPVQEPPADSPSSLVDVVGPVCESADFIAKDRNLTPMPAGDLFCMMGAGAYGASMSSNYNSRPRAAEVLVDGAAWHVARVRETQQDLIALERPLL